MKTKNFLQLYNDTRQTKYYKMWLLTFAHQTVKNKKQIFIFNPLYSSLTF